MNRHHAIAVLAGCAVLAWSGPAALAQSGDPNSILNQSSTLLKEQQELDARISASRSRLDELKQQQQRLNQETDRLKGDRDTHQSLCGSPGTYYSMRAECDQQAADLANANQNLSRQQREVGQRYQSTLSEADLLKKRQEILQQQASEAQRQLNQMPLSGEARDCVERLKKDNLNASVSAYQQCLDRSSGVRSQLNPEPSRFPQLDKPGPIEQMGIEDEKRRKRKAREAERGY